MRPNRDWLSSEAEVLKRIVENTQILANTIHFALDGAFPYPERAFGQDISIGVNIPRELLGLSPGLKPGDIDLLIIPFKGKEVLAEKTIAIEAKVLRPTIDNPGRNVNKMGTTQALGLLRDGFPFVGLVHLSFPQRLPPELQWPVKQLTGQVLPDGTLEEEAETVLIDPFPLLSAKRQYGRLQNLGLPGTVGFNTVSLSLSHDEQQFSGSTIGDDRRPLRNPVLSEALVKQICNIFMLDQKSFCRVRWFPENG